MSSRHFINNYEDNQLEISKLQTRNILDYSLKILQTSIEKMPPIKKYWDGGLYVGFIGLGYAMLHLSRSPLLTDKKADLLNQAKYYIEQDLQIYSKEKNRNRDSNILSFLLGNVGTLAVAINVYQDLGMKDEAARYGADLISIGKRFLTPELHKFGSDELFVGRSGYLSAYFLVKSNIDPVNTDLIYGIMDNIVNSGQAYAQRHRSPSPMMFAYYDTEYLGAGHGLAGILFFLMKSREYLQSRPVVVALIQQCLDYMISITPALGNLPASTDDARHTPAPDNQLTHWCHGAAGAIYTYGRAYWLWHNDKHLQAAIECGETIWKYGLLKKGPGICHGIAGSGYAFLLLYRLTGNGIHLNRANCFFDFLRSDEFKHKARIPDMPYSLFEGWAGTACFVADLAAPDAAVFPFFDVFD